MKFRHTFPFAALLCAGRLAAVDLPNSADGERTVSLTYVALNQGERISEVHLQLSGVWVVSVHLPVDWSFKVGGPVSGIASVDAEANHGIGMPFTTDCLRNIVTVVPCEKAEPKFCAQVILYRYDQKGGESERTLQLGSDCFSVVGSNHLSDPTLASVTAPAGQEPRHR
jgi:hypothetical protein